MKPASPRLFARLLPRRFRVWALHAAWPILAAGCFPGENWLVPDQPLPADRAVSEATQAAEVLPAPQTAPPSPPTRPPTPKECATPLTAVTVPQNRPRMLPVTLDAVLHLAEGQNPQVALARERLEESHAEQALAEMSWIPTINGGIAYYRHEGGIQDQTGFLVQSSSQALYPGLDMAARLDLRNRVYQQLNAERQVLQQQGELARITSENLLEAATTYIDLLAARTSEAVIQRTQTYQKSVLDYAEALLKSKEPNAEQLVAAIRAQTAARQQAILQLRQQGDAAAAKLAQLLGLGTHVQLVPADTTLRPVSLVDAGQSTDALVSQALASGPGIRELEQLLNLVQSGIDRSSSGRLLPVIEARTLGGAFAAGSGATMAWDGRFDLGLQARWNLSDLFTAKERVRVAYSKLRQVQLSAEDLRGRLALGVQEAQLTIQSTQEQLHILSTQVRYACEAYQLSDLRLKERGVREGGSPVEVMAAIQGVETSFLTSLNAIRNHNKAQVRLLVLLGAGAEGHHGHEGLLPSSPIPCGPGGCPPGK
jgi:outer membrane protein TolC